MDKIIKNAVELAAARLALASVVGFFYNLKSVDGSFICGTPQPNDATTWDVLATWMDASGWTLTLSDVRDGLPEAYGDDLVALALKERDGKGNGEDYFGIQTFAEYERMGEEFDRRAAEEAERESYYAALDDAMSNPWALSA